MLVTLAIVGIVAVLIASSFSRALDGARFRAAAREIASALRTARLEAVSRQEEVTFALDLEERVYSVLGRRGALEMPDDAVLSLLTARTEQWGENSGAIRFFADGSSSGGTVTLTHGESEIDVTVDWLTGRLDVTR